MTKKITIESVTKPAVIMEAEVARRIRQHGRSSMKAEICGVLIGSEQGRTTVVEACISGVNAAQGGAHVTFTQDTWEHIYKVKDKLYPEDRIVGWYHSHPGFGVFLSDHDMFIQENFFSSPQQIAWVYDPHSDEEGCFGWCNKKVEKLDDVSFRFIAQKSDTPEHQIDEDDEVEAPKDEDRGNSKKGGWLDTVITVLTYCLVFAFGGMVGFFIDGWLSHQINIIVPRAAAFQRQPIMPPGTGVIVIPGIAVDPELNQCFANLVMGEQMRQQNKGSGAAPEHSNIDPRECISQFEMRQSMRMQMQQTGNPFVLQPENPSAEGSSNNTQGSASTQQSGQAKGGQDGSKR